MPDFDSGHIFLTTLAPVKSGVVAEGDGTSHRQRLRTALSQLPTAMQSPATQAAGMNSPFARNRRTHLARMFVLDDVIYNGRVGTNPVWATIRGINPARPQPIDVLNAAYFVFCAEIDAVTEDGAPLPSALSAEEQERVRRAYARELWTTMGPELTDLYGNCEGFDGVATAEGFADYLEKCRVETTMPFHDYYLAAPEFHRLPEKPLIAAMGVPALVALAALLAWLFGRDTGWLFLVALAVTAAAVWGSARYALANGAKPLPPAEHDDLPSVLKALYVQQTFADFVVDHQGAPDAELHAAFGKYLEDHRPGDTKAPSQAPGVISIRARGGVTA